MRFCSPGNFSLVRIGDKTTCVLESNTITLCNPLWYCSDYSWLCAWCLCETAAVGNSGLCEAWESLGDVADMSSKQHSSQGCVGSAHGRLCTSQRESLLLSPIPFSWLPWLLHTEQMGLPGSAPALLLMRWVFSLQSAEQ